MAGNPKWCLSVNEWKNQFDNWITRPNEKKIILGTIFFNIERIYGNDLLVSDMTSSIYHSIHKYEIFLNYLGLNTLKNPTPLSFFRNFLVESSGEHKDQFVIKTKAIMPLVDTARLLTMTKGVKKVNITVLRFKKLAEPEPQNKGLYDSCINSFIILLQFRTTQGLLTHDDSGRFIDSKPPGKVDRFKLKRLQLPKLKNKVLEIGALVKKTKHHKLSEKYYSSDSLCEIFNIKMYDRHTVAKDAYITYCLFKDPFFS